MLSKKKVNLKVKSQNFTQKQYIILQRVSEIFEIGRNNAERLPTSTKKRGTKSKRQFEQYFEEDSNESSEEEVQFFFQGMDLDHKIKLKVKSDEKRTTSRSKQKDEHIQSQQNKIYPREMHTNLAVGEVTSSTNKIGTIHLVRTQNFPEN